MDIFATIWKKPYYTQRNQAMVDAGVNGFRVKCSHWGVEYIAQTLGQARAQITQSGKPVLLLADMPEAKIRLGEFPQNQIFAQEDQEFRFLHGDLSSDPLAYIPFRTKDLANALHEGDVFYLQDGQMSMEITAVHSPNEFIAKTIHAGSIVQCTGINIPHVCDQLDHLVPEIDEMLSLLPTSAPDMIAFSFVQSAEMLNTLKEKLKPYTHTGWNPRILAKIESPSGINNAKEILCHADGIMIARGDLALSVPYHSLGLIQKHLTALAGRMGKYCMVATGSMTSMLTQNIPSRSDILDVTNMALDGASALLLCNETAHNEHPERVVKAVSDIVHAVEHNNEGMYDY